MSLLTKLTKRNAGPALVKQGKALRAVLTWPKFSVTSYFMVSRLIEQGIVPRTVLDVGANVGQFAVASAKLFPGVRVHSSEPVLGCAGELTKLRSTRVLVDTVADVFDA
jgi:hypothetical protein